MRDAVPYRLQEQWVEPCVMVNYNTKSDAKLFLRSDRFPRKPLLLSRILLSRALAAARTADPFEASDRDGPVEGPEPLGDPPLDSCGEVQESSRSQPGGRPTRMAGRMYFVLKST